MARGPGKYDAEASLVRERTGAHTVVLLVLGGRQGEGFSLQTASADTARDLPKMLRAIADQIEGN